MEDYSTQEIKQLIRKYTKLDQKINRLKQQRDNHSKEFYSSHSLIGVMQIGEDYQRPLNVEWVALDLWSDQRQYDNQIKRLKRHRELIQEVFGSYQIDWLMPLLKRKDLSEAERNVFHQLLEIEYYLEKHAEARLKPIQCVDDDTKPQHGNSKVLARLKELNIN